MYLCEDKDDKKLDFICSLIELIGRKTNNDRNTIVKIVGKETLLYLYENGMEFHNQSYEEMAEKWICYFLIGEGVFNNTLSCRYEVPSYLEIGRTESRLIQDLGGNKIERLVEVYSSWIQHLFEDFNEPIYYSSSEYIFNCYCEGKVL